MSAAELSQSLAKYGYSFLAARSTKLCNDDEEADMQPKGMIQEFMNDQHNLQQLVGRKGLLSLHIKQHNGKLQSMATRLHRLVSRPQ